MGEAILGLLLGGLLVWLGIARMIDPEKAYKFDLLSHLFFPHSDPSKAYFIAVRISAAIYILAGAVIIFVGIDPLSW